MQTIGVAVPAFSPPRSHRDRARLAREELRFAIDDQHRLHGWAWWADAREGERRLAVLIAHGIGGSSASTYVVRAAVALHRSGHHVIGLDMRGAGASTPDVPSLYHGGLSSDLELVAAQIARDPRVSGVAILGFSGGGSMALKLAGEWGESPPAYARAVVSISAPLDYPRIVPWLDGLGRLPYRLYVLRNLCRGARAFARRHPKRAPYSEKDLRLLRSLRAYDETVTVPMHGFRDVDAYYAEASSGPYLAHIRVPALVLHAEDDPMVPGFTVRPWLTQASPSVRVAISTHGGHVGWIGGLDEASWIGSWPLRRAMAFFESVADASGRVQATS